MRKLALPNVEAHEVLIPCLARQLPAIMVRFQSARVIARNAITASAQASIRTVVLPQTLQFDWHLKLALACTITSALRTITPWTACVGPELSAVLSDLLPEDTWICREVASITGAQRDYDEAKHISCVLREDHEARANAMNQTLVIAAALAETPYGETECYATFLFKLVTAEGKIDWLLK
jgi:siderophore synthetase component